MILLNTRKTNCTSSVYGFMRQIRRRNNPNKETLIYIPYTSRHHSLSSYKPALQDESTMHDEGVAAGVEEECRRDGCHLSPLHAPSTAGAISELDHRSPVLCL